VGVATGPVKFVVEALRRLDWTWGQVGDWTACTYIRVHLRWVSWWTRRLLVVTGARCPLTKPVVAAVEQQAATEPHCSRGVQPGGICVYVGAARADSRGPGAGNAPRPHALPMPAATPVLYIWNKAESARMEGRVYTNLRNHGPPPSQIRTSICYARSYFTQNILLISRTALFPLKVQ
jgi:hypothetical protein